MGRPNGRPMLLKSKGMVSMEVASLIIFKGTEAAGVGVARLPMPCLLLAMMRLQGRQNLSHFSSG